MAKDVLRNIYSKEDLKKKLETENFARTTISFYRYINIKEPDTLRNTLYKEWRELGVLGRIYLAHEGINAQFNLPTDNLEAFQQNLESREIFQNMPFKIGVEGEDAFLKLTIKVKKYILADGLPKDEYDVSNVGKHLTAKEFNEAMKSEDTVVVDVRNHYESRIGHFKKAICPDVDTFKESLPIIKDLLKGKEEKKVLLYCTGGIRCEKTSSYLKHHGFKDVNQLHGGIISYAHQAKEEGLDCQFVGKNFVFDERIAERIGKEVLAECDQCENACDSYTNCQNAMCNLLFIQCNTCKDTFKNCCSEECQKIASMPIVEQRHLRKQAPKTDSRQYRKRVRPKLKAEKCL